MLSLADSASFLWRWRIYGETPPLDEPWDEVIAHAKHHFPRAGIHFADVHAAFAEAVSGEDAALAARITQLGELKEAGRLPQGAIIPALCAGDPRHSHARITKQRLTRSARRCRSWRGSAAAMRNAKCSRTRISPPACAPGATTRRPSAFRRGWRAVRRRATAVGSPRCRPASAEPPRKIRRRPSWPFCASSTGRISDMAIAIACLRL